MDGVSGVQVDLGRRSRTTLELEEGSAPTDEQIRKAVREAGFTAGEIRRPGQGIDSGTRAGISWSRSGPVVNACRPATRVTGGSPTRA